MKKKHPKVHLTKLGKERYWGYYDTEKQEIHLDPRLKGKKKLEVSIHEYFHHIFPDMSEEEVDRKADLLSDFLWLHQVRFVDNEK